MVRSVLGCLLLWLIAAAPAAAAEQAVGDGYRVHVPTGYKRVDVKPTSDPMLDDVIGALPVSDLQVTQTFFKGPQLSPEGVFSLSRWTLDGAMPEDPLALIEASLSAYRSQLHDKSAKVHMRRRTVDGYVGVEFTAHLAPDRGRRGTSHVHLIVIPGGSFVMAAMLAHPAIDATPTSDDWEQVVRTVSLSAPQQALKRLVVWAGVSVGALLLLLLLIRLLSRKSSGKRVDFSRAGESLLAGPSAYEGMSLNSMPGATRAHDGLPTFHGGVAPAAAPGARMPATPAPSQGASGPGQGLRSTLGNR